MTYTVGYVAGAQSDVEEVFTYLASEAPAAAAAFLDRLGQLESRLRDNPRIYQVTYRDLRCAYLRPFQYGVHYVVRGNQGVVIACIHASRDPRVIRRLLSGRR